MASCNRACSVAKERNVIAGTYEAANYDELIDCPVEMGEFQLGRFRRARHSARNRDHGARAEARYDRMTADLAQLCETQIRMFEPRS